MDRMQDYYGSWRSEFDDQNEEITLYKLKNKIRTLLIPKYRNISTEIHNMMYKSRRV